MYTSFFYTMTIIVKPFINTCEKVVLECFWLIARVYLNKMDIDWEIALYGSGYQVVYITKENLNNLSVAGAGYQVLINIFSRNLNSRNSTSKRLCFVIWMPSPSGGVVRDGYQSLGYVNYWGSFSGHGKDYRFLIVTDCNIRENLLNW